MRRALVALIAAALAAAVLPAASMAAPVAVASKHMEWVAGLPTLTGSSMGFFEREVDGAVRRYAAVGVMGYGVELVDITDPSSPTTVGRHISPGVSYHTDVHVNTARDILVMNVDRVPLTNVGLSVNQGLGPGVEFVDIADLSAPETLGVVPGLEGPHKLALIGDDHVYTTLPTYIIDYTDAEQPENLGYAEPFLCGHGISVDPTDPTIAYVAGCQPRNFYVVDVSDPARPRIRSEHQDVDIQTPHDAIVTADSSVLAISDLRGDYFNTQCPGGGIHFFDIGGDHIVGASPDNPRKLGTWFAPYTGARNDPNASDPHGSCTLHGFQLNPERLLLTSSNYMAGGWLVDVAAQTAPEGFYEEYRAEPGTGLGPTSWANTMGNWLSPGDLSFYLRWAPFDDPVYERTVFSISPTQGFEVLRYTGPLPEKISDLTVERSAPDGAVSGRLGRYPLLTDQGRTSKPLAGEQVSVSSGGTTVEAATDAAGRFVADLSLGSGSHQVEVTWEGDEDFRAESRTATVVSP